MSYRLIGVFIFMTSSYYRWNVSFIAQNAIIFFSGIHISGNRMIDVIFMIKIKSKEVDLRVLKFR